MIIVLHVFYIVSVIYIFYVEVWTGSVNKYTVWIQEQSKLKLCHIWNEAQGETNGSQITSHARLRASTQHAIRPSWPHTTMLHTAQQSASMMYVGLLIFFININHFLILLIQTHVPPQIAYTLCSWSTAWHLYIFFKTLYCRTEEHFYRATKVDLQIAGCD